MLIQTAETIMDVVRDFFAGHGPKSNNKVYMKSKKEMLTQDDFDRKRTSLLVRMFGSSKIKKRNQKRIQSGQLRLRSQAYGNKTIYERGQFLWRRGEAGTEISGNCGEMAMVSAYLAVAEHHIDPKRVWYGGIGAPGDHAFCLISVNADPTWATVQDMETFSGEGAAAVIIDPWLHVASYVVSYAEFAERTLKKWHRVGKRIAWTGKDYDGVDESTAKDGWYDTDGTYAQAFVTSPLTFYPAN